MTTPARHMDEGIIVADRNPHVRETLRRVLCQMGVRSGILEATTFRQALRSVRETGARTVLLDVELAMAQPAVRLRRIVAAISGLRVVVLLNEDLPGYRQAIADRWGYVCVAKERAEAELPAALRDMALPLPARQA